MQINLYNAGRMRWDLAFVCRLIILLYIDDFQSPIVGILEFHFVALVARIRMQAHGEQVKCVLLILRTATHPRDLNEKKEKVKEDINIYSC